MVMTIADNHESERRRKYFEEYSDRVDRHREQHLELDKSAIDLAASAMRALTYLNGGGLVAIPAAAALFRIDPQKTKQDLIIAGLLFVAGLLSIVFAQACAFFVQARRAEAEKLLEDRQIVLLAAVHYPGTSDLQAQRTTAAADCEQRSNKKMNISGRWRFGALVWFWLAVGFFIAGCIFGAVALLK
jgi:hypothetical protein